MIKRLYNEKNKKELYNRNNIIKEYCNRRTT